MSNHPQKVKIQGQVHFIYKSNQGKVIVDLIDSQQVKIPIIFYSSLEHPIEIGDFIQLLGRFIIKPEGEEFLNRNQNIFFNAEVDSILVFAKGNFISLIKQMQFKSAVFYQAQKVKEHCLKLLARAYQGKKTSVSYVLMSALILGEKSGISLELEGRENLLSLEQVFLEVGIFHILSVSGFHLAIISFIIYQFIIFLLLRIDYVARKDLTLQIATIITIPFILFYSILTGFESPTARSCYMFIFWLLARKSFSTVRLENAFSISALITLFFNPKELLNPSFQLSYLALLGILLIKPAQFMFRKKINTLEKNLYIKKKRSWLNLSWINKKLLQTFISLFDATCGAWLFTIPLTAYHFNQIQFFGIIGNFLIVPWIEFILLPIGFIGICMANIYEKFGFYLLQIVGNFSQKIIYLIDIISKFSISYNVCSPFIIVIILWYTALIIIKIRIRIGFSLVIIIILSYLGYHLIPSSELRIHFLSVGQGDSTVVELPSRKLILIDTGPGGYGYDAGQKIVVPFIRSLGYQKIDILILTHHHPDHTGGFLGIIKYLPIKEIWAMEPKQKNSQKTWESYLSTITRKESKVLQPYFLDIEKVQIRPLFPVTCLSPKNTCKLANIDDMSENNRSIVIQLQYGERKILFTGDIEQAAEIYIQSMIAQDKSLSIKAEIIKAPHHCSSTSSGRSFIEMLSPKWVICSIGFNNRYYFPKEEVVIRYLEKNATILRTDQGRHIHLVINSSGEIFERKIL